MATAAMPSAADPNPGGLSPAVRGRLQQCFERAIQAAQINNYDYAVDLLTQCVLTDPGNQIYVQSFLGTLERKYNNNKKGSTLASIRTAGTKTQILNSLRKKDWLSVIKSSLEVLKLNPWDTSTLVHIAKACGELRFFDCQLFYLKSAQDADPKSMSVHRECALALQALGEFDQAIACWTKVAGMAKPASTDLQEAEHAISKLQVEKTVLNSNVKIEGDNYLQSDSKSPHKPTAKITRLPTPNQRSRAEQLEELIAANPSDLLPYAELAEIHARADRWAEAESVLNRGLDATGGDMRIREQLEEVQLRRARHKSLIARKRAFDQKTTEANELAQRAEVELNNFEIDVFRKRVDRYPTNTTWKYELGLRIKRAGLFSEAIKLLQEARNDPKVKGVVLLELGECFQRISQFSLAMQHYERAIEEIPEKDVEHRKKALYRAGKLAIGLEKIEEAEGYLNRLAGLEYGYKDVSALLDKIAKERDK
ncbi:MAG TPA: hypothetical protein VGI75_07200 [Pirellulales bacterium]